MKLSAQQQSARRQFGRNSANYGSKHILADTSDIHRALKGIAFPSDAKALDIATGGGHTALYLARAGLRVTASDIAPAMLRNLRKTAAAEALDITTRCHAAEKLPYRDASFDLVSCRVAAHHFANPGAFLKETTRVLKPGGMFLLIDGVSPDDAPEASRWLHRIEKLRDPSHGRFLSPSRWKALCTRNGLTVRRARTNRLHQPDLNWYFETASTPPENRRKVLRLVESAPPEAVAEFRLRIRGERITWWWRRFTLLARKPTARTQTGVRKTGRGHSA